MTKSDAAKIATAAVATAVRIANRDLRISPSTPRRPWADRDHELPQCTALSVRVRFSYDFGSAERGPSKASREARLINVGMEDRSRAAVLSRVAKRTERTAAQKPPWLARDDPKPRLRPQAGPRTPSRWASPRNSNCSGLRYARRDHLWWPALSRKFLTAECRVERIGWRDGCSPPTH